jgi:hypothetical protein
MTVHQVFHLVDLLVSKRFKVGEIKPESGRFNKGPGLLDVLTEDISQGRVEEVGGGVVAPGGSSRIVVDLGDAGLTGSQLTLKETASVNRQLGQRFEGIQDLGPETFTIKDTGIPGLTTALAVKRCSLQDDQDIFAAGKGIHDLIVSGKGSDLDPFSALLLIPDEGHRA